MKHEGEGRALAVAHRGDGAGVLVLRLLDRRGGADAGLPTPLLGLLDRVAPRGGQLDEPQRRLASGDDGVHAGAVAVVRTDATIAVAVQSSRVAAGPAIALARDENVPPGRAALELGRRRIEFEGGGRVYEPGAPSVMRDALLARWERFRG